MFSTRIPVCFNDGSKIPDDLIREIETEAWNRFGGCTFGPPTRGSWVDDETGTVYTELACDLDIAIDRERLDKAREFVTGLKRKLKQEAMLFVVKPYDVDFL